MIRAMVFGAIAGGLSGCIGGFLFLICARPEILQMLDLPAILQSNTAVLLVPFFLAGAALGVFTGFVFGMAERELQLLGPAFSEAIRAHRYGIALVAIVTGMFSLFAVADRVGPGVLPQDPAFGSPKIESALEMQRRIVDVLNGGSKQFQTEVADTYYSNFDRIRRTAALVLGLFAGALLCAIAAVALESRAAAVGVAFWAVWLFCAGFAAAAVSIGGFGIAFNAFPRLNAQVVVFSILNAGIPGGWIALVASVANLFFRSWRASRLMRSIAASLVAFLSFAGIFVVGTTSRFILSLEDLPTSGPWSQLTSQDSVLHILLYFEGIHFPEMTGYPAAPITLLVTSFAVSLMIFGVLYGLNSPESERTSERSIESE